ARSGGQPRAQHLRGAEGGEPRAPEGRSEAARMSADRAAIEAELKAIGAAPDDGIDIGRAALALAALDRPEAQRADYLAHLDALARDVAALKPEGLADAAGALARTLAEQHRYRGDDATYDDMQNANLMRVIDRRRGLPVALGILYMHAGRAQGW